MRKVHPHELATADRLMRAGHRVEFMLPTGLGKTADALVDGERWEFKALLGSSPDSLVRAIRTGRKQSPRIVVDASRSPLPREVILRSVTEALRRYDGVESVRVITPDGHITERRP